jgi:hypothetical protein
LKGYRLWVMGQLDSTCRAPPPIPPPPPPSPGNGVRLENMFTPSAAAAAGVRGAAAAAL